MPRLAPVTRMILFDIVLVCLAAECSRFSPLTTTQEGYLYTLADSTSAWDTRYLQTPISERHKHFPRQALVLVLDLKQSHPVSIHRAETLSLISAILLNPWRSCRMRLDQSFVLHVQARLEATAGHPSNLGSWLVRCNLTLFLLHELPSRPTRRVHKRLSVAKYHLVSHNLRQRYREMYTPRQE